MMKIKIAEVAGKCGLKSAYALQKVLNISPTMASRLWKGEFDKIGIGTLEKLCEHFQLQTNEFLEYPLTQKSNTQSSNDIQKSNTELSNGGTNAPGAAKGSKTADGMLSTVEVAERLGLSRKSVNDYIVDGKLRATKGKQGHNFVSEADFIVFRDSRNV
jgi:DNA-binding Xre family transcriptional regulator